MQGVPAHPAYAFPVRIQLRELEVAIDTDSPAIAAGLAHLQNHADDHMPLAHRVRIVAVERAGAIELQESEGAIGRYDDLAQALAVVHQRIGTHLMALYDGHTFVHGGAVSIGGRLVVISGSRGAGKSTLLLRLALDGHAYHCDEHVVATREGVVRTLPRRLHIKPGTLDCLPEIAAACLRHPRLTLDHETDFYPLDPWDLGITWRSADGRAAAIVHLTPGFDGDPAIEPISQIDSVKRLFGQALRSGLHFGLQAADLCALVSGRQSFALRVGTPEATAAVLCQAIEGLG
jgi:hypothetical protein